MKLGDSWLLYMYGTGNVSVVVLKISDKKANSFYTTRIRVCSYARSLNPDLKRLKTQPNVHAFNNFHRGDGKLCALNNPLDYLHHNRMLVYEVRKEQDHEIYVKNLNIE